MKKVILWVFLVFVGLVILGHLLPEKPANTLVIEYVRELNEIRPGESTQLDVSGVAGLDYLSMKALMIDLNDCDARWITSKDGGLVRGYVPFSVWKGISHNRRRYLVMLIYYDLEQLDGSTSRTVQIKDPESGKTMASMNSTYLRVGAMKYKSLRLATVKARRQNETR